MEGVKEMISLWVCDEDDCNLEEKSCGTLSREAETKSKGARGRNKFEDTLASLESEK